MSLPTPERVRKYALQALRATPPVLDTLLSGITDAEADRRPDPERFTLREALAHMADWEPIWLERVRAIAEKDEPLLPGYDEGQFAVDNNYAASVVGEQATAFRIGRETLAAYVEGLPPEAWERTGEHGEIGRMTLGQLVFLVLAHDGYHLKQVVEFRAAP